MSEDNVTSICNIPYLFTLGEVEKMLPLLNRITLKHEGIIRKAIDKQRFLIKSNAPQISITEIDDQVCKEMSSWGRKMFKLGAKVFSGGYLGFDVGYGYVSWHYPETELKYWHDYLSQPSDTGSRRKIKDDEKGT